MSVTESLNTKRLKPRDLRVLAFIARYRLATVDALRCGVLTELSTNAVAKVANRLCALGYLRKFTLLHPTRYFVLAEVGTKALGLRLDRTCPLGPQALPTAYGVLLYCSLGHPQRLRLTASELRERWPWLPAVLATAPHAFDEALQTLELLRIDLGGPADHVARKCASDIDARRHLPEFKSLLDRGQFRLVFITATKEKSSAIKQALDRHGWPAGMRMHASVVPHLIHFTARGQYA